MIDAAIATTDDTAFDPSLSEADEALFGALENRLPAGWITDFEHVPGAELVAHIYHEEAFRSWPMFTVGRYPAAVAMAVRWPDGSTFSSAAFPSLAAVLDLIPGGIFVATAERMATVETGDWQDARH